MGFILLPDGQARRALQGAGPEVSLDSGFGAVSQDDVPPRGEFADPGVLDRGEVQAEGLVALGVAGPDLLELPVAFVVRRPLTKDSVVSSFLSPFQIRAWM